MAGLGNTKEGEVLHRFEGTGDSLSGVPVLELHVVVLSLSSPLHLFDPATSAEPVADEIEFTRVDQHLESLSKHGGDVSLKVSEPVVHERGVHVHVAFGPLAVGRDTERRQHRLLLHEVLKRGKVVTQRTVARLLDVVKVETGWVSDNVLNNALASVGSKRRSRLNLLLALVGGLVELLEGGLIDQAILVRKGSVFKVLLSRPHKTVANGETLEVDGGRHLVLLRNLP
mmetsp:Transcript_6893/g.16427  ORF Transcript_6893/g.16427 Transcript_6893/m.16427 type:complete len:228 (+) Transcript_6893:270-953(+)